MIKKYMKFLFHSIEFLSQINLLDLLDITIHKLDRHGLWLGWTRLWRHVDQLRPVIFAMISRWFFWTVIDNCFWLQTRSVVLAGKNVTLILAGKNAIDDFWQEKNDQ